MPAERPRESDNGEVSRGGWRRGGRRRTEMRVVEAADPALPAELNERLTRELREVVGDERVCVPADRPHYSQGEQPPPRSAVDYMTMHRFQFLRALAIALTFGAIISLVTNDWWFLVLAVAIHALGTMTVALTAIRMTTISEHPSPEVAAALVEAGIPSADEYFSRMVDEFRPVQERGAGEVVSSGYNDRTVSATADPALAGAQESSAMTPTAEPSKPGGQGGTPDFLIWSTAAALLVVSVVIPPVTGGGWMWALTAVMVPLVAAWMVLQWLFRKRGERVSLQGPGPVIAIVACTALAVAAFFVVVAFAFQH